MSGDSPKYLNVLQHRQIEKQINSQSFTEASRINDSSSISTPNASKLAVEVFQENQRLIAQIEQMKQSHLKEIRILRDEYELRISKSAENERKFSMLLQEKDEIIRDLRRQISQTNKDTLIQQQNEQIQKLNLQYENAIDSRCFQVEKFQAALDKVEALTKENQLLKNQISRNNPINGNIAESPMKYPYYTSAPSSFKAQLSQTPTQIMSNLNSTSYMPNDKTFSYEYCNNNYSDVKASTPPNARYGRKRAPPNHPALKEQIPYYFNQKESNEEPEEVPLDEFAFTLNELRTTLRALLVEKGEIEKRLSKASPVENTKYFAGPLMQRENDENNLDEVDKMIGRIKLELRRMGKL